MLLAARIRETFGLPGSLRRADRAVPGQGDDEARARRRRASGRRGTSARAPSPRSGRPRRRSATRSSSSRSPARARRTPTGSTPTRSSPRCSPCSRHVPEVSVEEFVDGEEFTFDTICADGRILFEHVLWYRPRPLQMRMHEWVSPVSISLRDLSVPHLAGGRRMGEAVLAALGFRTGFTHMEWYLKADGEAVFGEIGARPPGARVVDVMNFATDGDTYVGWAQAVVHGSMQPLERRYNAGADLQARPRRGPDHPLRGPRRADGPVRRARRARRPAAGRDAAPRLAVDGHRRRHDRRPASGAAAGHRDDRGVRRRLPDVRGA